MKFNKEKFLKLLKERKILKNKSKLLKDYDEAKNAELINFIILIEDQIFWESLEEYIKILDLFVSKKIKLDQFFKQFCSLRSSNLNSSMILEKKLEEAAFMGFPKSNKIDINVNPKSCGFTKIISCMHSLLDICDPNVTFEMNLEHPELLYYRISEEYLRLIIKQDFIPQIENYGDKS